MEVTFLLPDPAIEAQVKDLFSYNDSRDSNRRKISAWSKHEKKKQLSSTSKPY